MGVEFGFGFGLGLALGLGVGFGFGFGLGLGLGPGLGLGFDVGAARQVEGASMGGEGIQRQRVEQLAVAALRRREVVRLGFGSG